MINQGHLKPSSHKPIGPLPSISTRTRACHKALESSRYVTVKDGETPHSLLWPMIFPPCVPLSHALRFCWNVLPDCLRQPNPTLPSRLCSNPISSIKSSWLDKPTAPHPTSLLPRLLSWCRPFCRLIPSRFLCMLLSYSSGVGKPRRPMGLISSHCLFLYSLQAENGYWTFKLLKNSRED